MKTRYFLPLFLAVTATQLRAADTDPAKPLPAIHVSDNGRYFVKADGAPFFWLADTAWCIFNHPKPEEVDLYLDDRKAKGFTVIQGCVAVWDHSTRRNPDGQTPFNNAGRGATGNPTINEAFYKNVDSIIGKATQRGMYMAILPFWTKNTRSGVFNDPAVMGPYCEFLAKRYAAKNVFFVLGGDTGADPAIQPAIEAEAAGLLKGAKDAGVPKIMITYHPTGRQSSSFWFQDKPWLDFNSIQSGHFINTTNFQLVGDDYAKAPVKPTLDMEPGYENITNNLVRDASAATAPRIPTVEISAASIIQRIELSKAPPAQTIVTGSPGNSRRNPSSSSLRDRPVCCASALMSSLPIDFARSLSEMSWFGPVPTQELATWPWPLS